ncbi:hypothetical protein [Klenkia brasiliensis]|uniref:Uncharacterized protein n=1 Tax=Klenkia brasiliensis TaxID=333142 RepID=A0A1G7SAV9_9ACTN|nr:hypothetical protein [Klenkia brasiliensis]SDG20123.1 hypothetical protein SAMN05660324_1946 [Klenkia brasiliensis]
MSAPLRRVRDPQPVGRGWEIALIAITVVLSVVAGGALVGVGLAAAIWGDGWVWPATAGDIPPAVAGLVEGHPGAAYPETQVARMAGPTPTYVVVITCEAVLIVAGALLVSAVVGRSRAARNGMATRRQAEQALGVSGLRAARQVIRPDLHHR